MSSEISIYVGEVLAVNICPITCTAHNHALLDPIDARTIQANIVHGYLQSKMIIPRNLFRFKAQIA